MIKAVYKVREDGDYDFVAAFAGESLWDVHPADAYARDWESITDEEVIVKDFDDLTHLVDVLGDIARRDIRNDWRTKK